MRIGMIQVRASRRVAFRAFLFAIAALLPLAFNEAIAQSLTASPSGVYVVGGNVLASIVQADGKVVIGGSFVAVRGVQRSNIARLNADGSVDMSFDPGTDGPVMALAVGNGVIYVGGSFQTIAGEPRAGLAAVDATTGQTTPWAPFAIPTYEQVNALAVAPAGDAVFVGGFFNEIGGMSRRNLAAIATSDGGAIPGWQADTDSTIHAMALVGETLYIGGNFQSVAGVARSQLAALNVADAEVKNWNPAANSSAIEVDALVASGTNIYIGGYFFQMGGQERTSVAAVDATTGLATSWNPSAFFQDSYFQTLAIAASGNTLYMGGNYLTSPVNGVNLISVDATSGAVLDQHLPIDGPVASIAVVGNVLFVGGTFTHVDAASTGGFAQLDAGTLAPHLSQLSGDFGQVAAIESEPDGSAIIGGFFSAVGDVARNNLARITPTGDVDTNWNPDMGLDGPVTALHVDGNLVYVGGSFQNIGGHYRSGLAAIDRRSGIATAWQPQPDGAVYAIATLADAVYVGGLFEHVGNSARSNIAALDSAGGLALPWNPGSGGKVFAIATSGSQIYAGGEFYSIGGQAHQHLAAIDANSGVVDEWNPQPDSFVYALKVAGNSLYVGGAYMQISDTYRQGISSYSITSKTLDDWAPMIDVQGSNVSAIAISGSDIFIGESFYSPIGTVTSGAFAFDLETAVPLDWTATLSNTFPQNYYPAITAIGLGARGVLVGGMFDTADDVRRIGIAGFTPPDFLFHDGFD